MWENGNRQKPTTGSTSRFRRDPVFVNSIRETDARSRGRLSLRRRARHLAAARDQRWASSCRSVTSGRREATRNLDLISWRLQMREANRVQLSRRISDAGWLMYSLGEYIFPNEISVKTKKYSFEAKVQISRLVYERTFQ